MYPHATYYANRDSGNIMHTMSRKGIRLYTLVHGSLRQLTKYRNVKLIRLAAIHSIQKQPETQVKEATVSKSWLLLTQLH